MGGSAFDRLVARGMRAVQRARRLGRRHNVEAIRRGPADGSVVVSDASDPARFVEGVVTGGLVSPGFHAELDAFLAAG
jgi:hypothetical protein